MITFLKFMIVKINYINLRQIKKLAKFSGKKILRIMLDIILMTINIAKISMNLQRTKIGTKILLGGDINQMKIYIIDVFMMIIEIYYKFYS